MMTSQTRNIVKKTYRDTAWWVRCYKKLAEKQWFWHRLIRVILLSEIIIEFGTLGGGYFIIAKNSRGDSSGDNILLIGYILETFGLVVFIILAGTIFWGFVYNHTRKAEIFEIGNMECRLVKGELKALFDEIENLSDDEVLRKRGELARRVTEVTKWVQANTA